MTQQPTVGRIVHYQSYGTPGGEYLPNVPYAEEPTPGHWNWPPRVDDTTITVHTVDDTTTETVERDRQRRMRRYVK